MIGYSGGEYRDRVWRLNSQVESTVRSRARRLDIQVRIQGQSLEIGYSGALSVSGTQHYGFWSVFSSDLCSERPVELLFVPLRILFHLLKITKKHGPIWTIHS